MSNTKVLVGFVAGAAAGALAVILFAPDSTLATRKFVLALSEEDNNESKGDSLPILGGKKIRQFMHKAKRI